MQPFSNLSHPQVRRKCCVSLPSGNASCMWDVFIMTSYSLIVTVPCFYVEWVWILLTLSDMFWHFHTFLLSWVAIETHVHVQCSVIFGDATTKHASIQRWCVSVSHVEYFWVFVLKQSAKESQSDPGIVVSKGLNKNHLTEAQVVSTFWETP